MRAKDQQNRMKMRSGGILEDLGGMSGIEQRLQQLGNFARGMGTQGDQEVLRNVLASKQAQEFLTSVGNVKVPPSKAVRKPRPVRGARPPRMD
jgi:hypothetical protein|tara:strand:+ start:1363 stop:1641 length:279 start_codon:yes stop_codon:yes gene_type:complete